MRSKPSFFSVIATSMTILVIAPPMLARPEPLPRQTQIQEQIWKISQTDSLPQTATLIYVAPRANENGDGSPNNPYSSITAALATKPVAGTVIQLQQGVYSAETGEVFPIKLPVGVKLRGEPTVKGMNTLIRGSGKFISPSFASQNITMLANNDVSIEGLTITNPNVRGTAVWVESSKRVVIANNTFTNSDREGLFLTGTANAIITENVFRKNGANGLSAVGSSTGEIRNNIFESTGFGLAIGQKSSMDVNDNNILNNVDGIVISNLSAPKLRNNLIADNQRNGVIILKDRKGYPTPDLGTSINLGKNIFRNNLGKDLNNNSGVTQVAVGNELDPKKIAGAIAFVGESPTTPASQITSNPVPTLSPTLRPTVPINLPVVNTSANNSLNTVNGIEITRSPQPQFTSPKTPPKALPPSNNSTLIESLPDVPQTIATSKFVPSATSSQSSYVPFVAKTTIPRNSQNLNNDILIDRDSIPVIAPTPIMPAKSIPQSPQPITSINSNNRNNYSNSIQPSNQSNPISYNAKIAALVPPPVRETFPYLVVIPSADSEVLSRVQSAVPTAKIISSRFGNIIMVHGYPDRDRAEILKTIMRSEIGLDARVVHQNNL